jgi:hypothetical protein
LRFLAVAGRFVWLLVAGLAIIGLACVFVPPTRHLRELQRKKAELQSESVHIQEMINDLRIKQKRFRSDAAFVERTARETGRVKTNEVIFKFNE